jgi:hypothetical protein
MRQWSLLAIWVVVLPAWAQDATEIIRRSVDRDAYNYERLKNYTFLERTEERRYDRNGNQKFTEIETYEILILVGRPYGRLVERDDKPLSAKDTNKEQQKLDKELESRRRESERDQANQDKDHAEQRRFLREVPDAFNLTLKGSEELSGRPVWVIDAQPKVGYRPKAKRADLLTKIRGTIWVDQQDYQWVKADVEVIDAISVGLGLLRIAPGGSLGFEQVRVNDEVWLPSRVKVVADARLVYLKKLRAELDVTYRDYKKFQTDSRIVGAEETPPLELPAKRD